MTLALGAARRPLAAALLAAVLGASTPCFAQAASDKATAEALFDEGKKLMKEQKFAQACPKFELSQKLDPGVGTLGSLADCYEKAGKTASAWETFRETAAAAAARGQADREKFARARAAALEAKLSRLTIVVPAASEATGLEVRRDGEPVLRQLWGSATTIDPGAHTIEARAPGKKTWSTSVSVAADGAQASVTVPPLDDGESAPPPAATTATPTPVTAPTASTTAASTTVETTTTTTESPPVDANLGSGQRTAGLVVAGVGVVGLAVGSVFGLRARSKNADANPHCRPDDPTLCNPDGVALGNQAHDAATLSTIAFVVGGAALVGGVVLYFTAPKSSSSSSGALGIGVAVAPNGARFGLQGAF